jgi:hypothetical protein
MTGQAAKNPVVPAVHSNAGLVFIKALKGNHDLASNFLDFGGLKAANWISLMTTTWRAVSSRGDRQCSSRIMILATLEILRCRFRRIDCHAC